MNKSSHEPTSLTLGNDTTASGCAPRPYPFANPHISSFLALPMTDLDHACSSPSSSATTEAVDNNQVVQVVRQGADLTAESFYQGRLALDRPVVCTDSPQSIGMKVPPPGFTVRNVAELVGEAYPVHVLDVQLQTEMEGWTMGDLVEYFEDKHRQQWNLQQQQGREEEEEEESCSTTGEDTTTCATTVESPSLSSSRRPRRASALAANTPPPPVLNQLSLEVSRTRAGPPFVLSPRFVRDMDWIDSCWPATWRRKNKYPQVQYYCLTSAAGAWTDFHVDFGGTSVWYHVLSGCKQFCLVAPTESNLQAYQEWMCSKHQDADFFPDKIPNREQVYKICLQAHQTLIIPSGWIHAVYTPEDSLVLGGNFLHGLAIASQLQAYAMEKTCRVSDDMLFPYYRELHVCVAAHYYNRVHQQEFLAKQEIRDLAQLLQQVETWVYQDDEKPSNSTELPTVQKLAREMTTKHGFSTFGALLDDCRRRLFRSAEVASLPKPASETKNRTPRIRLRTKSHSVNTTSTETTEPKPRIRLSQPQRALPIPAKLVATRKREDASSFVDQDDEWIPTPSSLPKKTNKRPKISAKQATKVAKKATTSRNRLLKKLK